MQKRDTRYLTRLSEMLQKNKAINLAVGQPNFKPPANILRALEENAGKYTGYTPTQGLPELRGLIRRKLWSENKVKAEEILVTNGAIEAIFDTMLAHLGHGSEVILFSPYYGKYTTAPRILGAKVKKVPLKNNRPDITGLERRITKKTRMIVVNSPSNPTGVVYSRDEIKQLAEIADKHSLVLVSDEVYEKYVYGERKHISPGRFSDKVITINSFSKSYGFPGLRLGYLAGKQELVEQVVGVHASNTTCSPHASQEAAIEALKGACPVDLKSFDERRNLVIGHLDSSEKEYIHPEGAFYAYVYTANDSMALCNKLMKKGVLVMPSTMFGSEQNAIRISYAAEREELEKGMGIMLPLIK